MTYDKKMQLGQLLYFNNNVDLAIKAFRSASKLKPTAFEPHMNLVNIYVQKGALDQAIEECHEVLNIKSKHREVHLILGNLLRSQAGKEEDANKRQALLKEAEQEVMQADLLGADRALVHNTLGIIKVQQGDPDGAINQMKRALELNPRLPDANLVLGVLYFKNGDKVLALDYLDRAIKYKGGKNAAAWNTKADILYTMNRFDEALEARQKSVETEPTGDFDLKIFDHWN